MASGVNAALGWSTGVQPALGWSTGCPTCAWLVNGASNLRRIVPYVFMAVLGCSTVVNAQPPCARDTLEMWTLGYRADSTGFTHTYRGVVDGYWYEWAQGIPVNTVQGHCAFKLYYPGYAHLLALHIMRPGESMPLSVSVLFKRADRCGYQTDDGFVLVMPTKYWQTKASEGRVSSTSFVQPQP